MFTRGMAESEPTHSKTHQYISMIFWVRTPMWLSFHQIIWSVFLNYWPICSHPLTFTPYILLMLKRYLFECMISEPFTVLLSLSVSFEFTDRTCCLLRSWFFCIVWNCTRSAKLVCCIVLIWNMFLFSKWKKKININKFQLL